MRQRIDRVLKHVDTAGNVNNRKGRRARASAARKDGVRDDVKRWRADLELALSAFDLWEDESERIKKLIGDDRIVRALHQGLTAAEYVAACARDLGWKLTPEAEAIAKAERAAKVVEPAP